MPALSDISIYSADNNLSSGSVIQSSEHNTHRDNVRSLFQDHLSYLADNEKNFASGTEPTDKDNGKFWYDSTNAVWKGRRSAAWVEMVDVSATQTLSNKTFATITVNGASQFNNGVNIATGYGVSVNAVSVLTATTLGSSVVTSSLTTVGALGSGSITSGFGSINIGTSALTCGAISASGNITQQTSAVATPDTSADNLSLIENGDVGITILGGTTSPCSLLFGDSANVAIGRIIYRNGSDQFEFTANATSVGTWTSSLLTVNTALTCGALTSTGIDDNASSTALTITSNNNLLINNTTSLSADVKLQVHAALGGLLSITGNAGTEARLYMGENTTVGSGYALGQMRYNIANDYMAFYTNGSEKLRLDSSGNLGLGTTSISAKLHVAGGGGSALLLDGGYGSGSSSLISTFHTAAGSPTTAPRLEIDGYRDDSTASNRHIALNVKDDAGSRSLLLQNDGGNVGIGKTPSYKLDIDLSTEDFAIEDAGSAGATEQDWVQVRVGGNTGYIRVFASV
jgi:predicted acyltransferase (DUF342 family)